MPSFRMGRKRTDVAVRARPGQTVVYYKQFDDTCLSRYGIALLCCLSLSAIESLLLRKGLALDPWNDGSSLGQVRRVRIIAIVRGG